MDKLDRLEAGREVVAAKDAKGMSWQQLADTLERSLVWTTSALLGQQPLDAEQAQQIGGVLGLDDETVAALSTPPVRGEAALDPTEPVTSPAGGAAGLRVGAARAHPRGVRRRHHERHRLLVGVRARARPQGRPGQADVERQVPALQGLVTRRRGVGLTRPVRG
jgi:cyanate hydratase-like protein